MTWRSRHAQAWLAVVVLALAAFALLHQLKTLSLAQVRTAWAETPGFRIVLAMLATAISFACLAAYERFATERIAPGRIPRVASLRVGALGHALSNTLGFHALTASAFRYQQYRRFGLQLGDVAKLLGLVALCVGLGAVLVSAVAFAWLQWSASMLAMPAKIASLALLVLSGLLAWRWLRKQSVASRWGWRTWLRLTTIAILEMAAAIAALYLLLPAENLPGLAQFTLLFVGASCLGILSHAPGGIGVFEATMLAALPMSGQAGVLVALLLYRAIYNLLPFALALAALALQALGRNATALSVGGRV